MHGNSRGDILELIRRGGVTTRRHLSELTGLSRSVVAQTVAELIAEGLVAERAAARAASSRGRPTSALGPANRTGWIAAIDFGHRHAAIAITGLDGVVAWEQRVTTDVDGDAIAAFAIAGALLDAGLDRLGLRRADLTSVAIGIPHPVDKASGIVRAPASLPSWAGLSAPTQLGRGFTCPVLIDNDANLGAWGEYLHGAGRGTSSMLYIKVADGVGAGFVVDGTVFNGARGVGGEMGHVQVDPDGELCRCGRRGCLEAVYSSAAVRRRLSAIAPVAPGQPFEVTDATRPVFEQAGHAIGRVVAQLCNFLDPDAVVFGGPLGVVGEPLLDGVRAAFTEFGQVSAVRDVPVRTAALGVRSELVGAIDRAVQAAWAHPPRARNLATDLARNL